MAETDLSILIVSHGHEAELQVCLPSLAEGLKGLSHEIILIDNLNEPGFLDRIGGERPGLSVVANDTPIGFGANVNKAARQASGRVLLILNPDTEYVAGQIAEAVTFLEADPDRGTVAARLINPDGTTQRNFRGFPSLSVTFLRALGANGWKRQPAFYRRAMLDGLDPCEPTQIDWVYGSFMLIRKAVFDEIGGFDEDFFMYYEDVDLCYRLRRAGYSTWIFPGLRFRHDHRRDSSGMLPSKLQLRHVSSLLRYAWKDGAMIVPPRFGDEPQYTLQPKAEQEDPGFLTQIALAAANFATIAISGVLAGQIVSWISARDLGPDLVWATICAFGIPFLFTQCMLREYEPSGLGDTWRRVIGVIESAVIALFPFFAVLAVFFGGTEAPFPAFAVLFVVLAFSFLGTSTTFLTRRLTSHGAKIALVTDGPHVPHEILPDLPIGLQTIVMQVRSASGDLEDVEPEIFDAIRERRIDHVYVYTSQGKDADVIRLVWQLSMFDVPIWHARRGNNPTARQEVLRLRSNLRSRTREASKRGLDIAISLVALVLFAIPLCIFSILIYLEDPGPIFFGQRRLGRNQVPFRMLKFRSMYAKLSDEKADRLTTRDDNRITKIGAIMRRTSIDELPQVINVLKGEMSIVGPRPLPVGFHFKGRPFQDEVPYWDWRTRVAPGITGLSQLKGLRGTPDEFEGALIMMRDRTEFDNYYIDNWSIWLDIRIIFMTGLSGAFVSKAY